MHSNVACMMCAVLPHISARHSNQPLRNQHVHVRDPHFWSAKRDGESLSSKGLALARSTRVPLSCPATDAVPLPAAVVLSPLSPMSTAMGVQARLHLLAKGQRHSMTVLASCRAPRLIERCSSGLSKLTRHAQATLQPSGWTRRPGHACVVAKQFTSRRRTRVPSQLSMCAAAYSRLSAGGLRSQADLCFDRLGTSTRVAGG